MKKILLLMTVLTLGMLGVMAQTCPDTLRSSATVTITKQAPLIANLLPGKFSVSATKQVSFSKGNLQYLANEDRYRFAENQWVAIGNNVGNPLSGDENRVTNVDWIDLFGWATSGNPEATSEGGNYEPWKSETTAAKYGASVTANNTEWDPAKCDWGVVNMPGSGWRVLTKSEWDYLINSRQNATALRGLAYVHGIQGLVLLPDGWTQVGSAMAGMFYGFNTHSNSDGYTYQTITDNSWTALEKEGAVFLPTTGYRSGATVYYYPGITGNNNVPYGYYWSSTSNSSTYSYVLQFYRGYSTYAQPGCSTNSTSRQTGCAVRLVCDR